MVRIPFLRPSEPNESPHTDHRAAAHTDTESIGRAMAARLGLGLQLPRFIPTKHLLHCLQLTRLRIPLPKSNECHQGRGQCASINSWSPCVVTFSPASLLLETQAEERLYFPIFQIHPKWQLQVQCGLRRNKSASDLL